MEANMVKILLKTASVPLQIHSRGAISVLSYTLIPGPEKLVLISQVPPWALHLKVSLISIIWSLISLGD